jgi:hypothetical protein
MDRGFPIAYSPRLGWLFWFALLGRKHSEVHLRGRELHVRMGWAFDAHVPRSSIRAATRYRDVWWAIGVHTDLRGSWLVNGSAVGIVDLRLDPPARGRIAGIPINVSRLGLGLQDPEGFLEALGVPAED